MLYDKRISLDPRLSMIAEMVGTSESCADIGSDHGRLGAFLLQNRQCSRIALTDISAPSLDKARKLIALLGLEGKTSFCVGDGALALKERADVVVIAGMGGETIAEIIEGSEGRLKGSRLILAQCRRTRAQAAHERLWLVHHPRGTGARRKAHLPDY